MRERIEIERLIRELNQALLDAANAGRSVRLLTGTAPLRMGPTNQTPRAWIDAVWEDAS
jgi:hypothetical protein